MRRGKWEEKQYYRLDDESLDKYIVQLELDLETTNDITIEECIAMVSSAASRTLKSTYRRRNEDIQLLYDINEQPLKISEMDVEIEQYWNSIYKKHKNDIIDYME